MYAFLKEFGPMARGTRSDDPHSRQAIGKRLKTMRCGLGFSGEYMSKRIGSASQGQSWGNYEKSHRLPRYETLETIAQKFGFPILWILHGREDQLSPEQAKIIMLGEIRIAEGWRAGGKKARKSSR